MNKLRRDRWSTRLSLLAMVALLWTQLVLASHPACTLATMASATAEVDRSHVQGASPKPCHPPLTLDSSWLACESHCSRGELSPEVPRLLAVPALGLLPAIPVASVQHLPRAPDIARGGGPRHSWHRPTAHPASLLLL
jgi:hypothetical protein